VDIARNERKKRKEIPGDSSDEEGGIYILRCVGGDTEKSSAVVLKKIVIA
jgi:hypothetical protein